MRLSDCHNIDDFRRLAKQRLPWPVFDYIDGAADDELTKARNTASYADCDLVPDVLAGVAEIDTSIEILGRRSALPLILSPTALQHFAACPYRFLLYTVHRLEPRDEPVQIELMDPLTRGSLVHDVQFDVLTKLRDEGLLPLAPAGLDRALAIMEQALGAEAAARADALAPAIPRVWEDGLDAIRADLSE